MPPILLAVFHCSLYREHISSWGGGGLISISAPPRGATGEVMHNIIVFEISIHAPPRGATESSPRNTARRRYFNSRPSARGDALRVRSRWLLPAHFNSRPSARGDTPPQAARPGTADISIHAPPRGATEGFERGGIKNREISIHAPPRGATKGHGVMMRTVC